ncbi:MAG: hypothetical protein CMJ13_05090 [Pelagibacterales bacterium]|nr:hypothetical protein [Pelagibacterales bacterium]
MVQNFLIAGCGPGRHAINTAGTFRDSKVTAIDLSLPSLAYAKRMTEELGINNVDYLKMDILEVASLSK